MKRKVVSLLLMLVLAIAIFPTYSAFAEKKESFDGGLPEGWTVVKEIDSAVVQVQDKALVFDNQAGATEVRIPSNCYDDFVVSFKYKRVGGNDRYGYSKRFDADTTSYNVIYPYIGLKYFMSNDYANGYEMRLHYAEKGVNQSGYCSLYNDAESLSGAGLECRSIKDFATVNEHDKSVIEAFSFYYHELYENVVYNIDLVVCNGNMALYIDGEQFLTAKYTPQETDGNFAIRVGGVSTVTVDDFTISTVQEYAEKALSDFGEPQILWKDLEVYKYQRKAISLKKFLSDNFSEQEYKTFVGYKSFMENLDIFEEIYELDKKDKLTIEIINELTVNEYKTGSVIKIPDAIAYDYYENYYKVYVDVYFNGKLLEKDLNQVELNEVGSYNIVYTARNSKGETFINDDYVVTAVEKNNDTGVSTLLIIGVTIAFVAMVMAIVELIVTLRVKRGKRK